MNQKLKDLLIVISGFRKLGFMLLLLIVAIIFRLNDFMNGKEFVDLLSGTTIAFMSANGLEHVTNTVGKWIESKNP